jgi:hypothetical protein
MNEEKESERCLVAALRALKWAVVLAGALVGFSVCIVTAGTNGQIAGGVVAFIAALVAGVGMFRSRNLRK